MQKREKQANEGGTDRGGLICYWLEDKTLIENDWKNAAARTRSGIVEDTEKSHAGVAAQGAAGVV